MCSIALPVGNGPNNDQRLLPKRDRVGQWYVGRLVGEVFFAGEEAQAKTKKRPALLGVVVADGAAQHGTAGLSPSSSQIEKKDGGH
jgi:hypothetical protein